jgi:hypothetical protein
MWRFGEGGAEIGGGERCGTESGSSAMSGGSERVRWSGSTLAAAPASRLGWREGVGQELERRGRGGRGVRGC